MMKACCVYTPSRGRVCAYSHIREEDLPEGQKLLTCGRCGEVCYVSREMQLKHWKLHKKTCCPLASDESIQEQIMNEDSCAVADNDSEEARKTKFSLRLHDCIVSMMAAFAGTERSRGRGFMFAFQRFRQMIGERGSYDKLIEKGYIYDDFKNTFDKLLLIIQSVAAHDDSVFSIVWASPSFVNSFLSDCLVLSSEMQDWKEKGQTPPEDEVYVKFGVIDESTRHPTSYQLSPIYCEFIITIYHNTIRRAKKFKHQDSDVLRHAALSLAVRKQIMRNWSCPFSRVSFPSDLEGFLQGDGFPCRNELYVKTFLLTYWQTPKDPHLKEALKSNEVVPGMTFRALISILINDQSLSNTLKDDFDNLLMSLYFSHAKPLQRAPWTHLDSLDRLTLLDTFERQSCKLENQAYFSRAIHIHQGQKLPFRDILYHLLNGITAKDVLRLYYTLESDVGKAIGPHQRTIDTVHYARRNALEDSLPLTAIYGEIIETLYQEKFPEAAAVTCPQEVLETIAEFALPDNKLMKYLVQEKWAVPFRKE